MIFHQIFLNVWYRNCKGEIFFSKSTSGVFGPISVLIESFTDFEELAEQIIQQTIDAQMHFIQPAAPVTAGDELHINYICDLPMNTFLAGLQGVWIHPGESTQLSFASSARKFLQWYALMFEKYGYIGFIDQTVHSRIGVYPEEKSRPQPLLLSIIGSYCTQSAFSDDRIESAIDYVVVLNRLKKIAMDKHYNLLESLAEEFYRTLRREFTFKRLKIKIEKQNSLNQNNTFIEISRYT